MTLDKALAIVDRWANCDGPPRPPMRSCLCKSCRTYGKPGWKPQDQRQYANGRKTT